MHAPVPSMLLPRSSEKLHERTRMMTDVTMDLTPFIKASLKREKPIFLRPTSSAKHITSAMSTALASELSGSQYISAS